MKKYIEAEAFSHNKDDFTYARNVNGYRFSDDDFS